MFVNKDPKYFQALNIFLKSRFQGWLVKKTTGRRTSQLVITEEEEVHCRWLSCVPLRMRLLHPRLSEVACRSCNTAYLSLRCAENCSTSRAAVKSAILFSIDVDPMEEREEPCKDHKCREGRCVGKTSSKAGYKCVCKSGYGGQFCDRKSELKLRLSLL